MKDRKEIKRKGVIFERIAYSVYLLFPNLFEYHREGREVTLRRIRDYDIEIISIRQSSKFKYKAKITTYLN